MSTVVDKHIYKSVSNDVDENSIEIGNVSSSNNEVNTEYDNFLFTSLSSHFYLDVFLYQFLLHMTLPFSTMFSKNRFAQLLIPKKNEFSIRYVITIPILFYVMVVSYFVVMYNHPLEYNKFQGSLWYPLLFFSLHRVTIAVKYATLSKEEYEKFMLCKDEKQLFEYIDQVLNYEICSAAHRIGAPLNRLFFIIKNPENSNNPRDLAIYNCWKNVFDHDKILLQNRMVLRPDNNYEVSVYNFCKVTSYLNHEQYHTFNKYLSLFFAVVVTIIPFGGFIYQLEDSYSLDPLNISVWLILYLISSSIISAYFVMVVFAFIFVTFDDIRRKQNGVSLLHNMIKVKSVSDSIFAFSYLHDDEKLLNEKKDLSKSLIFHDKLHKTKSFYDDNIFDDKGNIIDIEQSIHISESSNTFILPLSFQYQENLISWVWSRLIILKLGERMKLRLEALVIVCLISVVILMISSFYLLFITVPEERLFVFHTITFRQNIVAVTIFISYLVGYSYFSANINFDCNLHRATLGKQLLKTCNDIVYLRSILSNNIGISESKKKKINDILDNSLKTEQQINSCLEMLRNHNDYKPLRVLGIIAGYNIPTTILTTSLSFYLALMSVYATALSEVDYSNNK